MKLSDTLHSFFYETRSNNMKLKCGEIQYLGETQAWMRQEIYLRETHAWMRQTQYLSETQACMRQVQYLVDTGTVQARPLQYLDKV